MKNMSDQKFKRSRGIAEVKASVFLFFFSFSVFFFHGLLWAYREKQTLKSESIPMVMRAPESTVAVGVIYLPYIPSSLLGHHEPCCM